MTSQQQQTTKSSTHPLFHVLGFSPIRVTNFRKTKQIQDLVNQLDLIFDIFDMMLLNFSQFVSGSHEQTYFFDPYVKDRRCQTQAADIYKICKWFVKRPTVLPLLVDKHRPDALKELHKLINILEFSGTVEEHRKCFKKSMEQLKDILSQLTIAAVLKGKLSGHPEELEHIPVLTDFIGMLLVYFILSSEQTENRAILQEAGFSKKIQEEFYNKKRVNATILKIAQNRTKIKEERDAAGEISRLPIHSYFRSFLVNRNYWVLKRIPIRIFVSVHCSNEIFRHEKFDLVVKEPETIDSLEQLQTIPDHVRLHLCPSPHTLQPGPMIIISAEVKLQTEEEFQIWYNRIQQVPFDHILLSYAQDHTKHVGIHIKQFESIRGTTLMDRSLFLLKHVYCCSDREKEPVWARDRWIKPSNQNDQLPVVLDEAEENQ